MSTASDRPKRLTYIVNLITDDDNQHFVHIPNLLLHLERLGWTIDLVSERGGRGVRTVHGRPVTYLSHGARWGRLWPLVRHLLAMRAAGGRLVFVRISTSAGFVSALLGRLLGWKTIYWLSDVKEDFNAAQGGVRGRFGLSAMKLLFRLVDYLATGPEGMVDYYRAIYGLPADKIRLLYNDLSLDGIAPAEFRPAPAVLHVLLVHRLSPARETVRYLPRLIEALQQFCADGRAVVLDIVGGGPELAAVQGLAQRAVAPLQVRVHGSLPHAELDAHYRAADLFVMPSYREGFPRVIIEAMARGLALVSTDAGGTRDLVGPAQKVLVFDRDDVEGFAAAVVRLLASDAQRRTLAEENLHSVRRFATPQVARMYDRVLSEVLAGPATVAR